MLVLSSTITDHNKNTTWSSSSSSSSSSPCRVRHHKTSNQKATRKSKRTLLDLQWTWAGGAIAVALAGALCFANSVEGQFVFDDSEAIVNNDDLRPEVPWWNAFSNDFWGTRLTHNTSHKSYRPLTVLSFRLNSLVSGILDPWSFHLTNVFLHALVSALSLPVFASLLGFEPESSGPTAFLCALLFAVHPVHTESVAGVVGRADLLCALFFFLAFLVYARACHTSGFHTGCCRPSTFSLPLLLASMCLCGVSMLCKEQGITVIGLCCAYDIIVVCRVDFAEVFRLNRFFVNPTHSERTRSGSWSRSQSPEPTKDWLRPLVFRHILLAMSGVLMIATRWHVMGSSPPMFQEVDNPASFAKTFYERTINYNYLYSLNAWLLVSPTWLCFDWSMGCIPLIRSALDVRILAVFLFWLALGSLLIAALFQPPSKERRCLVMALALLIIPFLPASNIFFRVGFVIAERVLYIPSAGFCLLVALGVKRLFAGAYKQVVQVCVAVLVLIFMIRCIQRSSEWHSEEILFRAGAKVCPLNAKVHYNIAKNAADAGLRDLAIAEYQEAIRLNSAYDQAMNNLANILKDQGELEIAEHLLEQAIYLRPDFAAAWMNLGIVQSSLKKHVEAEQSYLTAIFHRRHYPDCYYNLGNLYLDLQRYDDAYRAWRNATRLKPTHTVSWNNMIIMLDSTGDLDKAEMVALEALQVLPEEPSLHFNLANALGKAGRYLESERHFIAAVHLNPRNPTYHTNLGVLYHRWKKYHLAELAYRDALDVNPNMKSARDNLELLLRTVAKFAST